MPFVATLLTIYLNNSVSVEELSAECTIAVQPIRLQHLHKYTSRILLKLDTGKKKMFSISLNGL